MVNYGDDYFPTCICTDCSGPSTPRQVGKAVDNREESIHGKLDRKRAKRQEKEEKRKRNRTA
jgi:hypothetical protein